MRCTVVMNMEHLVSGTALERSFGPFHFSSTAHRFCWICLQSGDLLRESALSSSWQPWVRSKTCSKGALRGKAGGYFELRVGLSSSNRVGVKSSSIRPEGVLVSLIYDYSVHRKEFIAVLECLQNYTKFNGRSTETQGTGVG